MHVHDSSQRSGLWRSRWAAIGAAVAVSIGGGGALFAQAAGGAAPSQALIEAPRHQQVDPNHVDKRVERTAGTPTSDVAAALAPGTMFHAVTPYRSFDSRAYSDGLMLAGDEIVFDVVTDMFGTARIPSTAIAVTYNLTITGTRGAAGYLAIYPANVSWPGNSSINWFQGNLDLANGGVVSLGNYSGPGQIAVLAGDVPNTATDFIIDITGYYE